MSRTEIGPRRTLHRVSALFHGAFQELALPTEKRNPFLDGLRAIAIMLVINAHISHAFGTLYGANRYTKFPITVAGWMGVDLFFVLSGFFIGGQLWRELSQTGTISFGRFMMRRGLRIWPLYFFIFAVICFTDPSLVAARHYGWSDLLFVTNYTYKTLGVVNGSWSLCSEEQFYILAPLLLLIVGRKSAKTFRWILGSLFLLEVAVRSSIFHRLTGHFVGRAPDVMQDLYFPLHTHSDGLIIGLMIASFVAYQEKVTSRVLPWVSMIAGLILIAAAGALKMEYLNFSGLALFFGGAVWLSTQRSIKIFDGHIFYLLSRLSFGMYLNHEYLEYWVASFLTPRLGLLHLGGVLAAFASFLLLTTCSALLSVVTFCLIEHPFLVLRTALLRKNAVAPLVAH
jgi:peptidoglycan/LPS O-acetylase OafA/YrhL